MSDIQILSINENVAEAVEQSGSADTPSPPSEVVGSPQEPAQEAPKKARAKRAAKAPLAEVEEPAPKAKAKRAPRKAVERVLIDTIPIECAEAVLTAPEEPVVKPKPKPRPKTPKVPTPESVIEVPPFPLPNITDLLTQHLLESRRTQAELKQTRIHNMIAGKLPDL